MNPSKTNPVRNISMAAASALTLALAACGDQTPPPKASAAGAPPNTAAAQAQPVKAASEKSAEPAKPDPDAELAAKVKSAFAADSDLKMLPIDIRASGGAVTLYGTADNLKLKNKAAQVAAKVEGVKSVSSNLLVIKGS